jgi:hypothetical protein
MSRKLFLILKERLDKGFEGRKDISKEEVTAFSIGCPELDTPRKRELFVNNIALYE